MTELNTEVGSTRHPYRPVFENKILGRNLEGARGNLGRLPAHLFGRLEHRVATDHCRTACKRPDAVTHATGVARGDLHLVHRDTKLVRNDLGEHGLVTLALRRESQGDRDRAVREDLHGCALVGADSRALDVVADADAHQPALLDGLALLGSGLVVTECLEEHVEPSFVLARVVDGRSPVLEGHADVVGKFVGADEVAPAHLGGVDL